MQPVGKSESIVKTDLGVKVLSLLYLQCVICPFSYACIFYSDFRPRLVLHQALTALWVMSLGPNGQTFPASCERPLLFAINLLFHRHAK
jgi:hypothetical protein